MTAPDITTNETLEFEVTVSDGVEFSTSNVSVNVEDFLPVITISEASNFNAENSLDIIRGMTANTDGGYTLYWTNNTLSNPSPTSSQAFTVDGVKTGVQSNGEFRAAGNQDVGANVDVIQSGDTIYNVNIFLDAALMLGISTFRGPILGRYQVLGINFYPQLTHRAPKVIQSQLVLTN